MVKRSLDKDFFPSANLLLFALALLLIFGGLSAYSRLFGSASAAPTILGSFEYSAPECLNGSLWMMFFNPGSVDVSNISVFSGSNVYASMDLLEPDSTSAFAIGSCGSIGQPNLSISYCAGICKTEPLNPKGNEMGADPACAPSAGNSTPI